MRGRRAPCIHGPQKSDGTTAPSLQSDQLAISCPPWMPTPHSPLAGRGGSDDVEALGVLNGLHELLLRVLEALVLGEQQVVEAGVRGG